MSRQLFITIHLYLSSFFAAAVILVALSGGLYLIGVKGNIEKTDVATVNGGVALAADPSKAVVTDILAAAGIQDFKFDYVVGRGNTYNTRPTSEPHYILTADGESVVVTRADPSLQSRMMQLHMGHGPSAYRNFQKFFAAGMVFIILSGLWLGLSSSRLRRNTGIAGGLGLVIFTLLVMA